jgi:hypothetical protein
VGEAFVPFSYNSDVSWRWSADDQLWQRNDGGEPHVLSDGSQITAKNVIIQVVKIVLTDVTDVNGARSPKVVSTGSGTAYILRDGKMYEGTWERPSLSDLTSYRDSNGKEIPLAPGSTWVELAPTTISITFD